MNFALTPGLRRILAIAILFALPLLGWFAVVSPLVEMVTDRQSEIEQLQKRLAALQGTIARIPELENRVRATKEALDAAGSIWIGNSDVAIATALQDQLRQAVAKTEGTVKSSSYLGAGASNDKDLQEIKIRLSADGRLETLQQTLATIETARPPMFVDSMTIAAPAQFSDDKPPILSLDFEVSAFMRKAAQ